MALEAHFNELDWRTPSRHSQSVVKLLLIGLAWLTILGSFYFKTKSIYSGFFFSTRVPALIAADPSGIDTYFYQSFPLSPYYVLFLKQITGLSVEMIIYIPVVIILPLFWYFLLARELLRHDLLAALLAISVTFAYTGAFVHYTEYALGTVTYPMFLYLSYRSIIMRHKRYFVLTILSMLLLKGFAPHAEVWAVSFFTITAGTLWASERVFSCPFSAAAGRDLQFDQTATPSQLGVIALFAGVLLFWFSGKFYTGIIARFGTRFGDPSETFQEFIFGLLSPANHATLVYGAQPYTHLLSKTINSIYLIMTILIFAVAGLMLVALLIRNGRDYWCDSLPELVMGIAVLSYLPDMMMMMAAGQMQLYIFRTTGAIIPLGIILVTASRLDHARMVTALRGGATIAIVLFFVIGIASPIAFITTDSPTDTPPSEQTDATSSWINQYGDGDRLLADLDTFGLLRSGAAKETGSAREYTHKVFTDPRYAYVIGDDPSVVSPVSNFEERFGTPTPPERFDYVVLNWTTKDKPLQRGSPDWRHFEPIGPHKQKIQSNPNLNRVYTSGEYTVEYPR